MNKKAFSWFLVIVILGILFVALLITSEDEKLEFYPLPNGTIIEQLSPVYERCYYERGIVYCCAPPLLENKTLENKSVWICDSFRVLQTDKDIIILRNPVCR